MTQAAVSYQIKILEERVGAPLFLRMPRQVELTELGRQLAPAITEAFETMRNAFASLREDAEGTLSISVLATFAANWLAHRLGSFQMRHPSLAVRLDTSDSMIDFATTNVDIAIRSGFGKWPGLEAHQLIKASFTPMLSPALAATIGGVKEPADLLRLKIIDVSDPWWNIWFKAAGIENPQMQGNTQSRLGAQHIEGRATVAGQGWAFSRLLSTRSKSLPASLSSRSIFLAMMGDLIGSSIPNPVAIRQRCAHSGNGY